MSDELETTIDNVIVEVRAADNEDRIVEGIAVPYNETANMGYFKERMAPGAVQMADTVQLKYQHDEVIGKVLSGKDTPEGFIIRARISETPRGNEVYTLVKDGAINKFSIGFQAIADNVGTDNVITRTKVLVREVSLVPQPAYEGAAVLAVRSDSQDLNNEVPLEYSEIRKENNMENMETATTDLNEVRESVANLERSFEVFIKNNTADAAPVVDTRSAGEVLKAIAKGDENTIRAYTGGTTADAVVMNGWVGDLTRIIDEAAVLRNVFGSAALPSEGNYIEYAQLKTNGIDVDVQAAEGDDLAFGLIEQELKTAAVKTLGGYTTLSRQEIERSSVNILDASLRAMAIQVGKAMNAQMRLAYTTNHAAQVTATNTVTAGTDYASWLDAIVEAAVKFEGLGLSLDALVVDKATFKSLATLEASDGRPLMLVQGAGVNNVGNINVAGLGGTFANIPVVLDAGLTDEVAFVNRNALRMYNSPVVRLQDENIVNLSKDFSVYTYVATAAEIPAAVVPAV
jgi:uncharacterized protein